MAENRLGKLAQILTGYSTSVRKGSRVLIDGVGRLSLPLVREIYRRCLKRKAKLVEYRFSYPELTRDFFDLADEGQLGLFPEHRWALLKQIDVYVAVRAEENLMTMASIPREKIIERVKLLRPLTDWRVERTRWVVTRLPTEAMAQEAGLSMEEMDEIYFSACLQKWDEESRKQDSLIDILQSGRKIRIVGPDTDLKLDIGGMPLVKADGHRNMPDGEVFTAPKKTSAEGRITFNCPSYFGGTKFRGVHLEFRQGRVVKARADEGERDLEKILKTDEGSRYPGEFAFGLNPGIVKPVGNILFDEKISGSIHLALGNSYGRCSNDNRSAIHWDLVRLMTEGGKIYLDGKLIQKDGFFTLPELKALNPPD